MISISLVQLHQRFIAPPSSAMFACANPLKFMKTRLPLLLAATLLALTATARAQTASAFTYQGQLLASNAPANGYFDLQFTLFAASAGGSAVGGPIAKPPILVSNGVFTTSLDYGAAAFTGSNRWLEIAVRPTGSVAAYTTLTPRQRISATPYALQATTVADGAITAAKLSPGAGAEGQVLKMSGGSLAWGTAATGSGTVTSVATGTGLIGGPITNSGTLAIDTSVVPRLGTANTFTGANQFANNANSFVGSHFGNGSGLTNLNIAGSTNLNGANLTNLNASNISSGTLADARLSTNVALLNRAQTFSGTNIFTGVSTLTNNANRFLGAFFGNGAGLTNLPSTTNFNGASITNLNASNISSGTLADARLSANAALLNANQTFTGSNTFNGVSTLANNANRFVGAFFGNGAGLTNLTATATNVSVTLAGDVTGAATNNTVARIRGVNVSASAPTANQHLRYDGANWTPATVALTTDVSGTLPLANGGTGAGTAAAARANLGTAASGANTDITSLAGLTTPLSLAQGGSGATTAANARANFGAAASGANSDITSLAGLTAPLSLAQGGSGATAAAAARANFAAAASGANSDITSLTGLTTPLSAAQGGSGQSSFTIGDLLFANTATTLSKLTDVAAGNALISGGVGSAPAWGKIGLATHVTGTLALANGGTGGSTAPTARTALGAAASGANSDITSLTGLTTPLSLAQGGSGATTASAARANFSAASSGANSDITSLTGLTTPLSAAQGGSGQSSYTVGDLLFASGTTALGKLADVTTGNTLISGGVGSAPAWGKVGLTTHVTGTLPLANGGTAATTAAGARSALSAAASGANSDITSLTGLTTPLSAAQGGTGLGTLATGDLLYAPSANSLARRAIGSAGNVLTVSGGAPVWMNANAHDHLGQIWIGAALDTLYIENTATSNNVSGLTAIASGGGINYGVFGESDSVNGTGVQGYAAAGSGFTTGVTGESASPQGSGVYGLASSATGTNAGVYGETSAPFGSGVFGIATALTGVPVGVFGSVNGTNGYGLYTPDRLYVGDNAFVNGQLSVSASSRIFSAAGSSNAPAITFLNSTSSGLFNPATNVLAFATAGTERLRIAADGSVGLGRIAATNRLEVEGEASKLTAGGWLANSDARIKTDIHEVTRALETIERVRPVAFRYTPEYLRAHPAIEDKIYYNVVAQEFAEVYPDAVKSSGESLDGTPILQVDTYPAAITSIAAIRELHQLVEARDAELARLKQSNAQLEARLEKLEKQICAAAR
ncbi:MAG: hypothetical protein EPO07_07955 [Verrucomicrobia bacterium]|nr:MAG: hypothetical protein EPO07_07955 [Verrucomicrobiota bacterium]